MRISHYLSIVLSLVSPCLVLSASLPGAREAASSVHGLSASDGNSETYGLGAGDATSALHGLGAGNALSSVYGLHAGGASSGMYGLHAGGASSGMYGLHAGGASSGMYGLHSGSASSGMYGLNSGSASSGLFGLKSNTASSAMFSAPKFAGNGAHTDYKYGSSTIEPSNPTHVSLLCGTPRSYTRHVLNSAAGLVEAQDRARKMGIAKPKIFVEQEFLHVLTGSTACFKNLYIPGPAVGKVTLGSIAMFSDPAVPGGRRFAVAVNKQRCGRMGVPGEYMWIYLDDGFVSVSSCTNLSGLVGSIGPGTTTPVAVWRPRL